MRGNTVHENKSSHGLYAALCMYAESDYYPYHMPGHKRSALAGEMAQYYGIDITEIDGFDNLHHAEGILRDAQMRANRLYGADKTYYLVNGSTCGILAAVMAVTERGDGLLIARNCHKSVYHAAIMQELKVAYYYPPILKEYGIYDGADAEEIGRLLDAHPDCKAVVITSPTYEGIVSDTRAIADVVHGQGKILIVDEAHGAHLGLFKGLPEGAVCGGADIVIHSLHKTLPAMTQTALLHVQGDRVNRRMLDKYVGMLQTSSPSYVMMASMDSCIRYIESQGAQRFAYMRQQYDVFRKRIETCRHIRLGRIANKPEMTNYRNQAQAREKTSCRYQCHMAGWDIGKLVIFAEDGFLNGQQLYDMLRDEYHLQMEMAAGNYVLAIMTIMDTDEGWQRLADVLTEIDGRIEEGTAEAGRKQSDKVMVGKDDAVYGGDIPPKIKMTPSDAFHIRFEEIPLEKSGGRIAADFINLYPPGVPLLVPGEMINDTILDRIGESMRIGLNVQGITREGNVAVLVEDSI